MKNCYNIFGWSLIALVAGEYEDCSLPECNLECQENQIVVSFSIEYLLGWDDHTKTECFNHGFRSKKNILTENLFSSDKRKVWN